MINLAALIPTAAKLITPKVLGMAGVGLVLLYGVHLIKANATKSALIEQYKASEKNWIEQWDNLAASKKLSEDLAVKKLQRRSELETKTAATTKDISGLCDKNAGYCDTPIPPDIAKWLREHSY